MKHFVVLIGYVMIGLLAMVFLMGADPFVNDVDCAEDLDDAVNNDDPTRGTRFQLEGGCTYQVDAVLALMNGDEIAGPEATFINRAPAFDPEPTATIVGSEGLRNVIRPQGTVHLKWVKIVGGTGQYSGGSPVAGTGSGLAMGMASNDSSLYAVHITGNDGAGITNAHGTFDRIELNDTTQNPDFLGFIGSGLKAVTEVEVRNSYIHDNQGNGIWCDVHCDDVIGAPFNVFHADGNLVVNNGRAGIRWERIGRVRCGTDCDPNSGQAIIENNHVHGNGTNAVRGGIDVRDAQDALVRNNQFGADTHVGVSYPRNVNSLAIRATDSGRSDRPDLFNIDIVNNVLNGETIVGCEQPDEIVACSDAPLPPPPTDDTTPPVITKVVTGTLGNDGWYTSNVGVDWSVSDAESAISSQSGCDDLSVTSDQQETTYTCTATSAGGTSTESVTIKREATPPTVLDSTVPGPGATGVSPSINNVKATFSEAMLASSINGQTFMLFKNGSTTTIAAKVSYDSSTRTAKLNPTNNLQRGVTYRAVVTTGAKDVAGNALLQQKEWLFTVKR